MEYLLWILGSYILAVAIFTIIVKNDAMHKYSPHTNIKEIIIDGMKGMAIGFAITAAIFFLITKIFSWLG